MPDISAYAADVVVAGAGVAGFMAAIEAAEAGARTLLLEAESEPGGSGALAAGQTTLCETALEPGAREVLYDDLLAAHRGDHDEALVRLYVDQSGATYDRLVDLGVNYASTVQLAHMSRPWAHEVAHGSRGGATLVERLREAAQQRGVELLTSVRVRRLQTDGQKAVCGVVGWRDGTEVGVAASHAVVLTTGGFTRSPELIGNFGPAAMSALRPLTGAGSRGDGLRAAMALGAGTAYITAGIGPTAPVDPTTDKGTLVFYTGGVILNRAGSRFVRESDVYSDITRAALDQPEGLMIHVYDAAVKAAYQRTLWASVGSLTGYREFQANTLSGLLAALSSETGLDADAALATIEDYNLGIQRDGVDPVFGRRHLVGGAGALIPLDRGPFFGTVTVPGTTHFNGGLHVDENMRVMDVFGEPIPRLFAAGEIVGGFHGNGYMSGTQWGQALIFGRQAGIQSSKSL